MKTDKEILKEVEKEAFYYGNLTKPLVSKCLRMAIQLKQQADDRKFEDWKKRLKIRRIRMSKDFCLKDRRKILFKDCINSKNIVTIEFIFNEIEKQDKEFIKRLKEEANKHLFGEVMRKMIDKLSGFNNDDERGCE